jgi:putative toxin-antitoxin system antitoxin component (TIGR02293 family)
LEQGGCVVSISREHQHSESGRIAGLLGLPRGLSDIQLVERVERGFPAKTADKMVRRLDPKGRYLQVTDIIPKSTYHRRVKANQALTKDESEKILALAKVFVEVLRQYHEDTTLAANFLVRKHPMLGGRTPLAVANGSTAGADLVLKILARADAGVAA